MNINDYNIRAINDVYKNAHIAMQSISDLLPAVSDQALKKELLYEYEEYEKLINEISTLMKENQIEPKDISVMKKAMLWGSIKMKTFFDKSKNQSAEMMIKGTVIGINELSAMKNEGKNLDPEILALLEDLLSIEQSFEKRLRRFL